MRSDTFLALACATAASARNVVHVPIQRTADENAVMLQRRGALPLGTVRAKPIDESLANNLTSGAYFATVEIGTPGQTVTLHVDTGSTDVWVLAKNADLCTSSMLQELYGYCFDTYDNSKSSTFKNLNSSADDDFEIRYLDGSGASGIYFTDALNVGGMEVKNLQMGLARKSTSNWGMMGIGYTGNSASTELYPSIIDQMLDQNLINIKAYSLYLNDLEAKTGTILFGGYDTEKFFGTLKSVKTNPDASGHVSHFNVTLSSVASVSASGRTDLLSKPVPVILDSGTTLTYLPRDATTQLYKAISAYDNSDSSSAPVVYVNCDLKTADASQGLEYRFGGADGPALNVSISDLILDNLKPYIQSGALTPPSSLPFSKEKACQFLVWPATASTTAGGSEPVYLLGDSFLRSAYVVYDLTNDMVALAPANLNSTKENIVEIPANAKSIPAANGQSAPPPPAGPTPGSNKNAAGRAAGAASWQVAALGMLAASALFAL